MARLIIVNSGTNVPSSGDPPCAVTLVNDGTDWGARINAADVSLGSTAGAICCYGGGNIASQIALNSGGSSLRTLRFGPNATWTNSIPQSGNGTETILAHDNTLIEGHGWDTILQEAPGGVLVGGIPTIPLSWFILRPYATHQLGSNQVNNISMRNIQLSGVGVTKCQNASQSTVNTGLLNGGTYENIWFNKTHGIGLAVGESNDQALTNPCRNIVIRGCKYTNVGGAVPPDWNAGGGVSFAIVNGDHITLDSCTFIDALGNTAIDLEPNSPSDNVTNVTISNCLISQELSTGLCQRYVYGITIHRESSPCVVGPIEIIGCTFRGAYGRQTGNAGQVFPSGHLLTGIYINYLSVGGSYDVTTENNVLQACSSFPFVVDNSDDNTIKNNTCRLIGNNALVHIGQRNVVSGNNLTTASQQGSNSFGIVEDGASDYTTISNNTVVQASSIVGTHSTISGETIISRPSFAPVYTNPPTGTVVTTNANDLLLAMTFMGGHPQVQAPLVALQSANQPKPLGLAPFAPGYQLLTSSGAQTTAWTNEDFNPWIVALLALKGSATLVQQIDAGQQCPTVSLVASTTGGTLATGTKYYRFAGVYNGGEFLSLESSVAVTGPTGSVALTGNLNGGPAYSSYKIYRGTAPGVYTTYYTSASLSFTDTGAAGTTGSPPTALSFTGTLGVTPTNGNAVAVTYGYWANVPTSADVSSVSVGGIALTKGPSITFPWGIVGIWYAVNIQSATNGIVTATLAANPPGATDIVWFNASEWSGVATTNAVDVQATNSFPLTW